MKPRSWLIVILALGSIALVIGLILGLHNDINEMFNIDPTLVEAFEAFIEQYVKGLRFPWVEY